MVFSGGVVVALLKSRICSTGVAATVAVHAAFGIALWRSASAQSSVAAVPVMVSLIDSAGETHAPAPPRPEVKPVTRPQPLRAPPQTSDSQALDTPEALAPASPAEPVAEEAPAAASSITLPRFSADYLNNPPPVYPALSRRLGEQGQVMLRVLVRADGTPAEIAISDSSGSSRLDRAALEAVRRWRFVPARRGGTPVAAAVLVPISFTLEG